MTEYRIVKTTCGMCAWDCGLTVHVVDDKVVKVEGRPDHPLSEVCCKTDGMIEWLYSDKRITYPLKKVNGEWQRVSWDEALSSIASKLEQLRTEFGPQSLAVFTGQGVLGDFTLWARRFCDVYGTPNYSSGNSHCYFSRVLGSALTTGYGYPFPDYEGSRCIVLWGTNPEQSRPFEMRKIEDSLRRGTKLIVVNPRKIPLAKKADIYAPLRPGTDSALALGLLNVIISEKIYDAEFVREWTLGFDDLAEYVREFSPEKVEKITWVSAGTIRQFARAYATSKPACINLGTAIDHCTNGNQAVRAVVTLIAITGNHDIVGGNRCIDALSRATTRVRDRVSARPFNDKHPIFMASLGGEVPVHSLPEVILSEKPYPVKAAIVQGANPVVLWPNANRLTEALKKLEILVCMDLFMTETAQLAHFYLPACSFLERSEFRAQYQAYLPLGTLRIPAIQPLGESWPDWRFWFELGKRMGHGEYFPWESIEQAIDYYLEPAGITVEKLRNSPQGVYWGNKDLVRRYQEKGFPTKSGKVEIYSKNLEKAGYDPLPTYREPMESPVSQPEVFKDYPFILTAGSRIVWYKHSRYRMVDVLREKYPEPLTEINTDDAAKLNLENGDRVIVESPRGWVKTKVRVTDDILAGVVHVDYGWGGDANVNCLIDDVSLDPISGFPGYKSALCRVRKD